MLSNHHLLDLFYGADSRSFAFWSEGGRNLDFKALVQNGGGNVAQRNVAQQEGRGGGERCLCNHNHTYRSLGILDFVGFYSKTK